MFCFWRLNSTASPRPLGRRGVLLSVQIVHVACEAAVAVLQLFCMHKLAGVAISGHARSYMQSEAETQNPKSQGGIPHHRAGS